MSPLRRTSRFRRNIIVEGLLHLVHPTSVYMVEQQDSPDSILSAEVEAGRLLWGLLYSTPVSRKHYDHSKMEGIRIVS